MAADDVADIDVVVTLERSLAALVVLIRKCS